MVSMDFIKKALAYMNCCGYASELCDICEQWDMDECVEEHMKLIEHAPEEIRDDLIDDLLSNVYNQCISMYTDKPKEGGCNG